MDFDVVIIGAGLAGLSSGFYLKKAKKDLKILVLEAKDRVGGRTQTIELNSTKSGEKKKWDAGGQWVSRTNIALSFLFISFN